MVWRGKVGVNWWWGMIGDAYDQSAALRGMRRGDETQRCNERGTSALEVQGVRGFGDEETCRAQ